MQQDIVYINELSNPHVQHSWNSLAFIIIMSICYISFISSYEWSHLQKKASTPTPEKSIQSCPTSHLYQSVWSTVKSGRVIRGHSKYNHVPQPLKWPLSSRAPERFLQVSEKCYLLLNRHLDYYINSKYCKVSKSSSLSCSSLYFEINHSVSLISVVSL